MPKIAIQAAMPVEIENFAELLGAKEEKVPGFYRVYTAKRGSVELVLACSGIGKVNAAACAQKVIDCFGVEGVINMGIAGGIAPQLHTLDVVIGSEVLYHDFTPASLLEKYYPFASRFACDKALIETAKQVCGEVLSGNDFVVGSVASGDCFVESGEIKKHIRDDLGGLCCEMEGAAIGHVCALNHVPFLILRSISDLADEEAPMSYDEFEKKAALQANRVVLGIIDKLA